MSYSRWQQQEQIQGVGVVQPTALEAASAGIGVLGDAAANNFNAAMQRWQRDRDEQKNQDLRVFAEELNGTNARILNQHPTDGEMYNSQANREFESLVSVVPEYARQEARTMARVLRTRSRYAASLNGTEQQQNLAYLDWWADARTDLDAMADVANDPEAMNEAMRPEIERRMAELHPRHQQQFYQDAMELLIQRGLALDETLDSAERSMNATRYITSIIRDIGPINAQYIADSAITPVYSDVEDWEIGDPAPAGAQPYDEATGRPLMTHDQWATDRAAATEAHLSTISDPRVRDYVMQWLLNDEQQIANAQRQQQIDLMGESAARSMAVMRNRDRVAFSSPDQEVADSHYEARIRQIELAQVEGHITRAQGEEERHMLNRSYAAGEAVTAVYQGWARHLAGNTGYDEVSNLVTAVESGSYLMRVGADGERVPIAEVLSDEELYAWRRNIDATLTQVSRGLYNSFREAGIDYNVQAGVDAQRDISYMSPEDLRAYESRRGMGPQSLEVLLEGTERSDALYDQIVDYTARTGVAPGVIQLLASAPNEYGEQGATMLANYVQQQYHGGGTAGARAIENLNFAEGTRESIMRLGNMMRLQDPAQAYLQWSESLPNGSPSERRSFNSEIGFDNPPGASYIQDIYANMARREILDEWAPFHDAPRRTGSLSSRTEPTAWTAAAEVWNRHPMIGLFIPDNSPNRTIELLPDETVQSIQAIAMTLAENEGYGRREAVQRAIAQTNMRSEFGMDLFAGESQPVVRDGSATMAISRGRNDSQSVNQARTIQQYGFYEMAQRLNEMSIWGIIDKPVDELNDITPENFRMEMAGQTHEEGYLGYMRMANGTWFLMNEMDIAGNPIPQMLPTTGEYLSRGEMWTRGSHRFFNSMMVERDAPPGTFADLGSAAWNSSLGVADQIWANLGQSFIDWRISMDPDLASDGSLGPELVGSAASSLIGSYANMEIQRRSGGHRQRGLNVEQYDAEAGVVRTGALRAGRDSMSAMYHEGYQASPQNTERAMRFFYGGRRPMSHRNDPATVTDMMDMIRTDLRAAGADFRQENVEEQFFVWSSPIVTTGFTEMGLIFHTSGSFTGEDIAQADHPGINYLRDMADQGLNVPDHFLEMMVQNARIDSNVGDELIYGFRQYEQSVREAPEFSNPYMQQIVPPRSYWDSNAPQEHPMSEAMLDALEEMEE